MDSGRHVPVCQVSQPHLAKICLEAADDFLVSRSAGDESCLVGKLQ